VGGFYFIQYPEGQYSLDYIYDSVKQDTLLEDLGRYAILLLIQFDARETDRQGSTTADSPYPEHVFLVCTDGENRTIFFQRIVNELQRWWIAKSWD
jgi:hypothetical protein